MEILAFTLLALAAPMLTPYDPALPNYQEFLEAPSARHWAGTDAMGRDLLSRILHGMRLSLVTAFVPTFLSLVLGAFLGMAAALSGPVIDALILRAADVVLAYPFMIFALAMIYNLGPGFVNLIIVLCLTGWAGTARVVRTETARLGTSGFMEAARTTGVRGVRLMVRHVLPNIRPTLLVLYTINVPGAILSEAGLSFLGLGAQPPLTSLGLLVAQGREHLLSAPLAIPGPRSLHLPAGHGLQFSWGRDSGISGPRERGLPAAMNRVLELLDLKIGLREGKTDCVLIENLNLSVPSGRVVGLVGESGCGKSVTALAASRLLRPPLRVLSGESRFKGVNLLDMPDHELRALRGREMTMVFQDPSRALNPLLTVEEQIGELLAAHGAASRSERRQWAAEILRSVGIPNPETRLRDYPHEFSGGMRQRILIAMAMALRPSLILADEPTTALDVTVQSRILALLRRLQRETGAAILLITHDLRIVASLCDEVYVMYAGEIVERTDVRRLFKNPLHPYTRGLMDSIPRADISCGLPRCMEVQAPERFYAMDFCRFAPRCPRSRPVCLREKPRLFRNGPGHEVRCFFPDDATERTEAGR